MKVAMLELISKFEEFIEDNPNSSDELVPFMSISDIDEVEEIYSWLKDASVDDFVTLLTIAKDSQALLQFIWTFGLSVCRRMPLREFASEALQNALDNLYAENDTVFSYETLYIRIRDQFE